MKECKNDSIERRGQQLAEKLLAIWGDMMLAGSIYLGDRLGLYKALVALGSCTAEQLSQKLKFDERFVREWLEGQVAAEILLYDAESQLFSMPQEAIAILGDEHNQEFMGGIFWQLHPLLEGLNKMPKCFRTGQGFDFDALGSETILFQERVFQGWYRNSLVQNVLPQLGGIISKLTNGAKVADVGCGSGIALLVLAEKFPKSKFYGYELSRLALQRAEENLGQTDLKNVVFYDVSKHKLPDDQSFDLILSFDCVHDMADPQSVIDSIYKSLNVDGTWFVSDLKVADSFAENLKNPLAKYFYACSLVCCLPSACVGENCAKLGTLGFGPSTAKAMITKAGFRRFKMLDIDNPFNLYYEARP